MEDGEVTQVPPHAVTSERYLLANLMCPAHPVEPLEPRYFYDRGHQLVGGAVWVLTQDGAPCTERAILRLLFDAKRYTWDAEIALRLLRLTPYTSRRELAQHRANVVDAYHRRQVVNLLRDLAARAQSGEDLASIRKSLTEADVWGTT